MRERKPNPHVRPRVDMVNHPPHYKANGIEVIDVIEAFGLDKFFRLANAVKYILRFQSKGGLEDLKKAKWYLDREIVKQEEEENQ